MGTSSLFGKSIQIQAGRLIQGELEGSRLDELETSIQDRLETPFQGESGEIKRSVISVALRVGSKINKDDEHVSPKFVQQVYIRHAVNELPTATLKLSKPTVATNNYKELNKLLYQFDIGQPASISVTLNAGKGSKELEMFHGVVAAVTVNSSQVITVKLKSRLQGLKASTHSLVWAEQGDAKLVRSVLAKHNIPLEQPAHIELPINKPVQRVQWNCSDWHFLRAILGQQGAWLWPMSNGSLRVHPPRLGKKKHTISANSSTLLDIEWHHSGLNLPEALTTKSWDLTQQAVVVKQATVPHLGERSLSPTVVKPLARTSEYVLTGHWDAQWQEAAANSLFTAKRAMALRVRLTLLGALPCQVGDTIELKDFSALLDGEGIVTQVEFSHDVKGQTDRTIISVGLDEEAAMAPSLPVPSGLMIGQVAPYQTDPRGVAWNRLPVKVPGLGAQVIWARMGHVYASDNSGVTFYPEVGDEVTLGFVGQDPVIVASLHNPKRKAAIVPDAKNAQKGMVLRHGDQLIALRFDRDKAVAALSLGGAQEPEQHLVIDKVKGLHFIGKKGNVAVEVLAGGGTVTTKQKLVLSTEAHLMLSGKAGVAATSDKNVSLEAKENLTGQGKARVQMASAAGELMLTPQRASLSADSTNVTGKKEVKVSSNAVDLKAKDISASATESVTVKAVNKLAMNAAHVAVEGQQTDVGGGGATHVKGMSINLG
ncbi:contractile injection system protein, VgrG/Pvc8 family [Serratia bockelmannii]|uniref:contractile injection system protein, VgrG/Pvc8 family n=1 Tax=Serratia bockelmannii TaxID=2703793 RepID=UPI003FA73B02